MLVAFSNAGGLFQMSVAFSGYKWPFAVARGLLGPRLIGSPHICSFSPFLAGVEGGHQYSRDPGILPHTINPALGRVLVNIDDLSYFHNGNGLL